METRAQRFARDWLFILDDRKERGFDQRSTDRKVRDFPGYTTEDFALPATYTFTDDDLSFSEVESYHVLGGDFNYKAASASPDTRYKVAGTDTRLVNVFKVVDASDMFGGMKGNYLISSSTTPESNDGVYTTFYPIEPGSEQTMIDNLSGAGLVVEFISHGVLTPEPSFDITVA